MQWFKYTNHFAKNVIQDRRLKLSEAQLLNDPFEMLPLVDPSIFTIEMIKEALKRPHMVEEAFRRYGKDFSDYTEYRSWHFLPSSLETIARDLIVNIPANVEAARDRFAEQFSAYWRILCGSQRHDSILMWSHYTNNHSGIVLEFETDDPGFPDIGNEYIFPVIYSKHRPSFHYIPGVDFFIPELLKIAKTKASEWAYEQEVRLMVVKSECIDGTFLPFRESSLRRVLFGCRCPSSFREEILALLSVPEYSHVLLEAAHLSRSEYKLQFAPISTLVNQECSQ